MRQATDGNLERGMEGSRVFYFRHSKAAYGEYTKKLGSEVPTGEIDIEDQALDDLTPEGHDLAQKKAQEFLSTLDPAKDVLFVVSSNLMRALQTASIYAKTARELGFRVIRHDSTGTDVASKVGDGYVRSIDTLSLGGGDALQESVFNPPSQLAEINWDAVSPEMKEKWEKARHIVLNDDKGSWGANLFAHSAAVKDIFPEMKSSQDLHDRQYKNLLRLTKFAKEKAGDERINVLAFGHENYVGVALHEDTGNHALPNCEAVEVKDGKLERIAIASK